MAVRFCEGGIGGRPGRHFGWRLSGYLKVLLWVRLFSFGLSVFAVDADWMAVAPLPASDLLRCDVTAFPDHVKLFNIGLMVLRNTGPTSRAVLRIANRTYAAWDQAVVNEEVAASAATCCVTNWSALFARSQETHHAKSHEALVGAPAACTNDTPFALGPPVNFSRGLHGGLFRDWNHVKYNHLTMHQRRTNRCWHNATSSLDQGDKEAKVNALASLLGWGASTTERSAETKKALEGAAAFLSKCLTLEPKNRWGAAEAADCPWLQPPK